jgi:hypothetical protein
MLLPQVKWNLVKGVTYNGYPIYQSPTTNELAWDTYEQLVALPRSVETMIRSGKTGLFS